MGAVAVVSAGGSKTYIAAAALMQTLESFNFLDYNIKRMGEDQKDGGHVHVIDNNNEHSMEADLGDGSFLHPGTGGQSGRPRYS